MQKENVKKEKQKGSSNGMALVLLFIEKNVSLCSPIMI